MDRRLALIRPTLAYDGFHEADIVVEAVFEGMALKKQVFAELDRAARRRPASSVPSPRRPDRKSTRLNSSHSQISYAVFWLKKKSLLGNRIGLLPAVRLRTGSKILPATPSSNRICIRWSLAIVRLLRSHANSLSQH